MIGLESINILDSSLDSIKGRLLVFGIIKCNNMYNFCKKLKNIYTFYTTIVASHYLLIFNFGGINVYFNVKILAQHSLGLIIVALTLKR